MLLKKVLLIVASNGYQPLEYSIPKKILEHAGIQVVTASDKPGIARASDNTTTLVDYDVQHVNPEEYDGIFLIGGPGALQYLDNQPMYAILKKTKELGKIYGAICISPRILAHAHVLKGHRATGWDQDNLLTDIFYKYDVTYVKEDVVVDGKVITATGPHAAQAFGKAIVKLIK